MREKASLAYSAFSSYNANKGVILAYAGIDVNKYDQALEIIKKQIDDTGPGALRDEEFEATLKGFETQYRMRLDTPDGRIYHHLGGQLEGCPESIDESMAKVVASDRGRRGRSGAARPRSTRSTSSRESATGDRPSLPHHGLGRHVKPRGLVAHAAKSKITSPGHHRSRHHPGRPRGPRSRSRLWTCT